MILTLALCTSCSLDNDNSAEFYIEVMPVQSVEIPEEFVQGETYEIFMTYIRPSTCKVFNNLVFDIQNHERTVTILNTVYPQEECSFEAEEETISFELTVSGTETYLFKFFQGTVEGVDHYHLVEVPVVE